MEIKEFSYEKSNFYECDIDTLLGFGKRLEYTGFYIPSVGYNKYVFKVGNDFYIFKAVDFEMVFKKILNNINNNLNSSLMSPKLSKIKHAFLNLNDLMNLYKFNNNIRLLDTFAISSETNFIQGNYSDFLNLVRNVIEIECDLKKNNIDRSDKYAIMKFIYDKYKMSVSYWCPVSNYGVIGAQECLLRDKNRVVNHPYDYLGLINENYATCQGMATGLVELYMYFGIDASFGRNSNHAVCKVELLDDNGYSKERRVTYIDLSKEVTRNFQDNKYEYINGVPIPRRVPNRRANPSSYDFFMNRNANIGSDGGDFSIAVDYKPQIKIVSVNGKPPQVKRQIEVVSVNGKPPQVKRGR